MCNTSTGCVLGGSGLGSGRREETPPGDVAAIEILKPLLAGACVDEHIQDQVSTSQIRRNVQFSIIALFITDDNFNGISKGDFKN